MSESTRGIELDTHRRCTLQYRLKLKGLESIPVWIKEHPKSYKEDYSNTVTFKHDSTLKATISPQDVTFVIFESPGTTLELDCIHYGIPYLYCFEKEAFPLTDVGKELYDDMLASGKVLNVTNFTAAITEFYINYDR